AVTEPHGDALGQAGVAPAGVREPAVDAPGHPARVAVALRHTANAGAAENRRLPLADGPFGVRQQLADVGVHSQHGGEGPADLPAVVVAHRHSPLTSKKSRPGSRPNPRKPTEPDW